MNFKRHLSALVGLVSMSSFSPADSLPRQWTVVAFGDSITAPREGVQLVYSERIQRFFSERDQSIRVVNSGIGGNTTNDARERWQRDVLSHRPDIVILQFGANDAMVRIFEVPPKTQPRVGLGVFSANIVDMIREAKARGIEPIVVGPTPLRWSARTRELYGGSPYDPDDPDGLDVVIKDYRRSLREVAVREGVPYIDLDEAFRNADQGLDSLYLDGLHPNDSGHRTIADLVTAEMLKILAGARGNREKRNR